MRVTLIQKHAQPLRLQVWSYQQKVNESWEQKQNKWMYCTQGTRNRKNSQI